VYAAGDAHGDELGVALGRSFPRARRATGGVVVVRWRG